MKRITVFMIIVFLALGLAPSPVRSAGESYVIGRITGIQRELPGYFHNNRQLHARGIDRVEFPGFRLLNVEDGRRFLIRPNHDGYFYQGLPGGIYILTRKRNDRPGYKEPKMINIMSFEVEPETLVNVGTINIILDGDPNEYLLLFPEAARGKYTYRYSYERQPGDSAFDGPLNWFMDRRSKIAAGFGDRVSMVDTDPTVEKDSSKVVLKEGSPFFGR